MERDEIIQMWKDNDADFQAIADSVDEYHRTMDTLTISGDQFAPEVLHAYADLVQAMNGARHDRPTVSPAWFIYRGSYHLCVRRFLTFDELIEAAADKEYYRQAAAKRKADEEAAPVQAIND